MLVGYARVSSTGQDLQVQFDQLTQAGCETVFAEKRSGTTTDSRTELAEALRFVRSGDTLVVTRLDRLARSVIDLHQIVAGLNTKGVGFRCLQQGGVDTTSTTGRLTLAILAAVAEFETDLRKERQREGIEKAKAKGVYKGRPAKLQEKREEVKAMQAAGIGATEIAKRLGIGRASVYRLLADAA